MRQGDRVSEDEYEKESSPTSPLKARVPEDGEVLARSVGRRSPGWHIEYGIEHETAGTS